jgi:putative ABC transport system permease protein
MNTFFMAVSERTKEIGILMAMGWSRIMIMRTIISESMMICFLGGLLGNLMALVQLWFFHTINPEGLGWLVSMSVSVEIFWESMGLSLLLGWIGSLYPAFRASKLLPAEALRYE